MARHSTTGKNVIKPKALKTRGGETTKAKRRTAPVASPRKRFSVSDLEHKLQRRNEELNEARDQQAATAEILKVINARPGDLTPVFDVILEKAHSLCDVPCGSLQLFNDDHTRAVAVRGMTAAFEKFLREGYRLDRSQPVQSVRPFQIDDLAKVPRNGSAPRVAFEMGGLRTMLSVPLVRDGIAFGRIVAGRPEVRPFSEHQIAVLQSFADQAVIAIENARLFNEVQAKSRDLEDSLQQQTATADVLKVISRSAFDLQAVLDTLVESAARLCEADSAALHRPRGDAYPFVASYGYTPEYIRYMHDHPLGLSRGSVLGRAVLEGKTVQVVDVKADTEYRNVEQRTRGDYRTVLGVPLMRVGVPIGIIMLTRKTVRRFTDKQIELVTTFADQAVIAIENVRLFDEVQARTRDLSEALTYQTGSGNILRVIASSPTEVGPVLKAIVESACELCEAYDAVLRLKQGDNLELGAHHGTVPADWNLSRINQYWTAGRAALERRPVHVHDMSSSEGDEFQEAQARARTQGHRTILSVPLLREDESIGTITLRRLEVNPFSERQIALLQTFADQAVIAIGNVRLFEEVQARTRDLTESLQQQTATSEVLKVISSSPGELEPVFRSMLENAVSICDAKFGNLFLIDGDSAHWEAGVGTPPKLAEYFTQSKSFRPTPGSHLDRVMRTKQVSHTDDDTAEAVIGAAARLGGARSTVCVPMVKDGALVGTIFIYRTEVRPFTDKQIDIVKNFAAQAVIAIENTRLLNELRQRTDALTASLEELRAAQDRLIQTEKLASLGQLTAGIAHEIKNPLNFVNNFAALSAELTDELKDMLAPAPLVDKTRIGVDELTGLLKDNLQKVVQHGRRADSIVKNMLLHSREGSGEHRSVDLNGLVDESLNLAYHGARAEKPTFNVRLSRDFDPDAGTVEVFPQEITRVLLNLISNGFYAVSKRAAQAGASFEPELTASTRGNSKHVEIRIRDNGTGIRPEVQQKMFNPFFTTKPAGEGTGLGLSMSHDIIVKQHGGRIHVDTEPGIFTEFVITLPRATSAQKPAEGA